MKPFTNFFKVYYESGSIGKEPGCNAITFINAGSTIIKINNSVPLPAAIPPNFGGILVIEGNQDEEDKTQYSVQMEEGVGHLIVITKAYKQ